MPAPQPVPDTLLHRAFTTAEARAAGVSKDVLTGSRFRRLHRGVYCCADAPDSFELAVSAARLLLPDDAALSHVTALRWYGVMLAPPTPVHFSTNTGAQTALDGVVLHRRLGHLSPRDVRGVPVLGPDRTFVDSATQLGHVDLVRAGDWLVRLGLTTPETLARYVTGRHLDGVRRARRVAPYVERRVDSPMETDVRLLLMFARLPVPEVNVDLFDPTGTFVARGDLVYRAYRLIVEYDGWQHERDAKQRQKDHLRRERLEALGWRVIVITIADMRDPVGIATRVHDALVAAGYSGAAPVISTSWRRWFVK